MEEIEVQTDGDIQQAERRKTYTELANDNQKLIEENTRISEEAARLAKENNNKLDKILKKIGDLK